VPDQIEGWTVATLKQYFDQRLLDIDKAVQAALAAAKEAVRSERESSQLAISKSEENAEKWRDNANEWRGAMTDRERTFATAKDLEQLKQRVDEVRDRVNTIGEQSLGGRRQKDDQRTWIAALVGVVIGLIALWRVFTGH